MDIDKIYQELNLTSSKDFTTLAKTLNSLVDEKILTYNSKGEFAPLEYFNMAYGIIDVKDAGFAFLDTEFGGIFIPPSKLKGAITYDEVMVKNNKELMQLYVHYPDLWKELRDMDDRAYNKFKGKGVDFYEKKIIQKLRNKQMSLFK